MPAARPVFCAFAFRATPCRLRIRFLESIDDMQHRFIRLGAIALTLTGTVFVASCDDEPTSPELLQSWTLESLYGQEPPVLVFEAQDPDDPDASCAHVLVSSEIELRTEQHVDRIDALTETCGEGDVRAYTETLEGTWTMEGDSLFLELETQSPLLPSVPLDGRIVGDQLRFEFEVFSEGGVDTVAIVYRRVI